MTPLFVQLPTASHSSQSINKILLKTLCKGTKKTKTFTLRDINTALTDTPEKLKVISKGTVTS